MSRPTPAILLVEDDEVDVISFQRLARKCGLEVPITIVRDGSEALALLTEEARKGARDYIVLTDLNMPLLSGHELIEAIRRDKALRRSIIFVVTSSDLTSDKARAYDSNVAGYIVKDTRNEGVTAMIEMLERFCRTIVPPPPVPVRI